MVPDTNVKDQQNQNMSKNNKNKTKNKTKQKIHQTNHWCLGVRTEWVKYHKANNDYGIWWILIF